MAPKGWEWDAKNKEWFSDYPENIELEENLTRPSDWEPRYRSLGECTGTVYVWQENEDEGIWIVTAILEGPGVSVEHCCGEFPVAGLEPNWDKVDALVSDAHDAIYEHCLEEALSNDCGNEGDW